MSIQLTCCQLLLRNTRLAHSRLVVPPGPRSISPFVSLLHERKLNESLSAGHCAIRHIQTHQIRREVHHYSNPRYATLISWCYRPQAVAHSQSLGDGIGTEVAESVKTVFKADNVPIQWEQVDVTGVESGDKHSEELFRESIASLKRNKLGVKGTSFLRTCIQG